MTDPLSTITLLYGLAMLGTLAWGLLIANGGGVRPRERRDAARTALLCWAWPLILAIAACRHIAKLWRLAEWKDPR